MVQGAGGAVFSRADIRSCWIRLKPAGSEIESLPAGLLQQFGFY